MKRFAMACSGLFLWGAAQAGTEKLDEPYVGVMGTWLAPSSVRDLDVEQPGVSLHLGADLSAFPGWAAEITGAWNEADRKDGSGADELYHLGIDVLRKFEPAMGFVPYVVTGLSLAYEDVRGDSSSRPAIGLGGGAYWQTPLAPLRLRLDARALAQENDYENSGQRTSGRTLLVDGRFGLGLDWVFGRAVARQDSDNGDDEDGDGVADERDLCPASLPGTRVDETGCEAMDEDSDNDGVPDHRDQCPGTARGVRVDNRGCEFQDAVVLQGVNFEFDSARLTAEAREILRTVARLLQGGLASVRVEIAGHTDEVGGADYNQALSARRAQAVKQFLAGEGVDAGRLVATGYGSRYPVADNSSEAGRAQNRRVEFRVLD